MTSRSWLRRIPEKIRWPPGARCRDQMGNASIKISLKRFAVMMSNFPVSFCFKTSPVENSMLRTRLARAFRFAVAQARGSLSIAKHPARSEITAGDGQNAAARAGIEHRPTRFERTGDLFEKTKTHRGSRVLARSKSGFGRNDDRFRRGFCGRWASFGRTAKSRSRDPIDNGLLRSFPDNALKPIRS